MKNAIVIALALVSVTAFSNEHKVTKEAKKAAVEACKAEGKTKKDLKACVKEKTAAPAAEAKMETAPVAAPAPATK
jgi:hypothetical protein